MNNKIAAGEVGDDLRKVASTLSDTVTQTERTVEKKVSKLSIHRLLLLAVCLAHMQTYRALCNVFRL